MTRNAIFAESFGYFQLKDPDSQYMETDSLLLRFQCGEDLNSSARTVSAGSASFKASVSFAKVFLQSSKDVKAHSRFNLSIFTQSLIVPCKATSFSLFRIKGGRSFTVRRMCER